MFCFILSAVLHCTRFWPGTRCGLITAEIVLVAEGDGEDVGGAVGGK